MRDFIECVAAVQRICEKLRRMDFLCVKQFPVRSVPDLIDVLVGQIYGEYDFATVPFRHLCIPALLNYPSFPARKVRQFSKASESRLPVSRSITPIYRQMHDCRLLTLPKQLNCCLRRIEFF